MDSDRYNLIEEVGRGCWGRVYSAKDRVTGKDVAIKIIDPDLVANDQAKYRDLDLNKEAIKEGDKLFPWANVVPRRLEFDRNGQPFIVMPYYERFLSDRLNDNGERNYLDGGFDSLDLEEVLSFTKDIVSGLIEIHRDAKIAHADIKPDNLVLDGKKVLVTDLGTSTYHVLSKRSENPRDNMGCIYTRAPKLFIEGNHPDESTDIFSVSALFYRMIEGMYPFEDELNCDPNYFREFINQRGDYSWLDSSLSSIISRKVEDSRIPEEFKSLIRSGLNSNRYTWSGNFMHDLEDSIKSFEENKIKISAVQEYKKRLWCSIRNSFIGAASIATIMGVIGLTCQLYPRNTEAQREDFMANVDTVSFDKTRLIFEAEDISPILVAPKSEMYLRGPYNEMLEAHDGHPHDLIVHRWTKDWIELFNGYGVDLDWQRNPDIRERYYDIRRKLGGSMGMDTKIHYNDFLEVLLQGNMINARLGDMTVDLEDTLTATLVGPELLWKIQRQAESTKFSDYSRFLKPEERYFLTNAFSLLREKYPELIVLQSNSKQNQCIAESF